MHTGSLNRWPHRRTLKTSPIPGMNSRDLRCLLGKQDRLLWLQQRRGSSKDKPCSDLSELKRLSKSNIQLDTKRRLYKTYVMDYQKVLGFRTDASRQIALIFYNGPHIFALKYCPFAWGIWTPSNIWFPGPTRVKTPDGITINSSAFAGFTVLTDRPTEHGTATVTVTRYNT